MLLRRFRSRPPTLYPRSRCQPETAQTDILRVQDLRRTIKRFDNIECSRLKHGKVLAHARPNGPAVLPAHQLGQLEIAPVSMKPSRLHLCNPLAANVLVEQDPVAQPNLPTQDKDSPGPESH